MRKSSDVNRSPTATVSYESVLNSTIRVTRSLSFSHEPHEVAAHVVGVLQIRDGGQHRPALPLRQAPGSLVVALPLDVRLAHRILRVASRVEILLRVRFTRARAYGDPTRCAFRIELGKPLLLAHLDLAHQLAHHRVAQAGVGER